MRVSVHITAQQQVGLLRISSDGQAAHASTAQICSSTYSTYILDILIHPHTTTTHSFAFHDGFGFCVARNFIISPRIVGRRRRRRDVDAGGHNFVRNA